MRHHAIGLGPCLDYDDAGRKKVRTGRLRVPFWDNRLIGLLFAGGIVLTCIPIPRPSARRVLQVDWPGAASRHRRSPSSSLRMESPWPQPTRRRVAVRVPARGWSVGRCFNDRNHYRVAAVSPDGNFLALGGLETDVVLRDLAVGYSRASPWDTRDPDDSDCVLSRWPAPGGERTFPDRCHSLGPRCRTGVDDLARPNVPGHQPGVFARRPVIGHRGLKRPDDHRLGPRERRAEMELTRVPGPRRLAHILARGPHAGVSQCSRKAGSALGDQHRPTAPPGRRRVPIDECRRLFARWVLPGHRRRRRDCRTLGASRPAGELASSMPQSARLTALVFSPHGQTLAAIGVDNDIRFWDMADLRLAPHRSLKTSTGERAVRPDGSIRS